MDGLHPLRNGKVMGWQSMYMGFGSNLAAWSTPNCLLNMTHCMGDQGKPCMNHSSHALRLGHASLSKLTWQFGFYWVVKHPIS
jgi:hypothetical protein